MQLISELEGTTRGPYAGCVGYFSFPVGRASARAGSSLASPHQEDGGWVNDSEPEAEFQETVNRSMAGTSSR